MFLSVFALLLWVFILRVDGQVVLIDRPKQQRRTLSSPSSFDSLFVPELSTYSLQKLQDSSQIYIGYVDSLTSPERLAIFCGGIRSSKDTSASILVFVESSSASKLVQEIARKYDVGLVVFNRRKLSPSTVQNMPASSLIWVLSREFLEDKSFEKQPYLVVCDVKELYLQGDVVKYLSNKASTSQENAVYVFADSEDQLVRNAKAVKSQLNFCFGEEAKNLVRHRPLVHAELVAGYAGAMLNFADSLFNILIGEDSIARNFPSCRGRSSSMAVSAIVNFAAHAGLMSTDVNVVMGEEGDLRRPIHIAPSDSMDRPMTPLYDNAEAGVVEADIPLTSVFVSGYHNIQTLLNTLVKKYSFWKNKL